VTQTCGSRKIKRAAGVISGLGTTAKTPDQKQRHDIGRARRGDMPVLRTIAKKGIQSATDFLKSFGDKVYYHGSVAPDIKKFDPNALPNLERDMDDPRGATYFTTDPGYADEILSYGTSRNPDVSAPLTKGEYETGSTVYPVKLKMDHMFDPKNTEDLEELRQAYGPKYYDREIGFTHDYENQTLGDINLESWMTLEMPNVQEALKDAGFRGYLVGDEPGTVGLFYPDEGDVRSIFAKYNPTKSKAGEILASVPAAAVAGYGALDMLGEENGQGSD
tara:strand:+ start:322 stop:1149 length:828 start_codon:yes stop_codon:yes gene_type:complete